MRVGRVVMLVGEFMSKNKLFWHETYFVFTYFINQAREERKTVTSSFDVYAFYGLCGFIITLIIS